jgi:DNA-binding MarR family transcriptional regulator
MTSQEIIELAKRTGVMISNRTEYRESLLLFAKKLIDKTAPKPLTYTQTMYLDVLDDWMSLHDLAKQFGCTPQNALKMIRALEARGLVIKESLFRRKAWAFYYRRKI